MTQSRVLTVREEVIEGLRKQVQNLLETARTARENGAKFEKDAQRSFDHANYIEERAAELKRVIAIVEGAARG